MEIIDVHNDSRAYDNPSNEIDSKIDYNTTFVIDRIALIYQCGWASKQFFFFFFIRLKMVLLVNFLKIFNSSNFKSFFCLQLGILSLAVKYASNTRLHLLRRQLSPSTRLKNEILINKTIITVLLVIRYSKLRPSQTPSNSTPHTSFPVYMSSTKNLQIYAA